MADNHKHRKTIKKLWKKSPNCRKCGQLTVLNDPGKKITDNTATYQHTYPKGHPNRGKVPDSNTLWCNRCNREEGEKWGDQLAIDKINTLTDIEELREIWAKEWAVYNIKTMDITKIKIDRIDGILERCTAAINRIKELTETI